MKVFVTGASGFIGSAVLDELIASGHMVAGLARSDEGAATVAAARADVVRGTIQDLDTLKSAASAADGVIHCAFNHDFSNFAQNSADDRAAIEAIGSVLKGTDKPLLVTHGIALLAQGRSATERDMPPPVSDHYPRASEAAADELAKAGVAASVIRLPTSVHDTTKFGFVSILIATALEKGVSAYIADGANRWPAVHRRDAARGYRLALERGGIDNRYHVIAEEGIATKAIAEAIATRFSLPTKSITPDEAPAHFGWFAMFAGLDAPAASDQTREVLGWTPTHPGLLDDIANATGTTGY